MFNTLSLSICHVSSATRQTWSPTWQCKSSLITITNAAYQVLINVPKFSPLLSKPDSINSLHFSQHSEKPKESISLHSPKHHLNQTQETLWFLKPQIQNQNFPSFPHTSSTKTSKTQNQPNSQNLSSNIIIHINTFTSSKFSPPIPKNKTFSLSSHFIKNP